MEMNSINTKNTLNENNNGVIYFREALERRHDKKILSRMAFIVVENFLNADAKRKRFDDMRLALGGSEDHYNTFNNVMSIYPAEFFKDTGKHFIRIGKNDPDSKNDYDNFRLNVYIDSFFLNYLVDNVTVLTDGINMADKILGEQVFDRLVELQNNNSIPKYGYNILAGIVSDRRMSGFFKRFDNLTVTGDIYANTIFNGKKVSAWSDDGYEKHHLVNTFLLGFIWLEINKQLVQKNPSVGSPAAKFANFMNSMMISASFWDMSISASVQTFAQIFGATDNIFQYEMTRNIIEDSKLYANKNITINDGSVIKKFLEESLVAVERTSENENKLISNKDTGIHASGADKICIAESFLPPKVADTREGYFTRKYLEAKHLYKYMTYDSEYTDKLFSEVLGFNLGRTEKEKLNEFSRRINQLDTWRENMSDMYMKRKAIDIGHDLINDINDEYDDSTSEDFREALDAILKNLNEVMAGIKAKDIQKLRMNIIVDAPEGYKG